MLSEAGNIQTEVECVWYSTGLLSSILSEFTLPFMQKNINGS